MAENVKSILDYLRSEGVEISDAAAGAAEKKFSGQVLAPSGSVLAEGQIAISKDFNDSKTQDLARYKEEARKNAARVTELEDALLRGDKVASEKLKVTLAENAQLKGLAEKFMADKRARWDHIAALAAAKKLPDALKPYYRFPKEGEQLGDDDVLYNVAKFEEHVAVGALKDDGAPAPFPPGAPRVPPAPGVKPTDERWRDRSPSEKIAYGHVHAKPGSSASVGDYLKETEE